MRGAAMDSRIGMRRNEKEAEETYNGDTDNRKETKNNCRLMYRTNDRSVMPSVVSHVVLL